LVDEELALRQLLADCKYMPNNFIPLTNILYSLSDNMRRQKRHAEDEIVSQQLLQLAESKNSYTEIIWGLSAVLHAAHICGKEDQTIVHTRRIIRLISEKNGPTDPRALNYRIKLEKWLREWGKAEEADELKRETSELIEQHAEKEVEEGMPAF